MLLHNMGLIHSVAQRLGGRGLEYDDLVGSGVPGLVRAIELLSPLVHGREDVAAIKNEVTGIERIAP